MPNQTNYATLGSVARIDALIASRSIAIAFQPFIDVLNHHIHGYEALARPSESTGFVHVGALLKIARAANRSCELETHLAERAIEQFMALRLKGRLFINLSPEALGWGTQNSLSTFFSIPLRRHSLPFQRCVIELTEQQTSDHPEILQRNIDRLRITGVFPAGA